MAKDEMRELEEGRNAEFRMVMALLALEVGSIMDLEDKDEKDTRLRELKVLLESHAGKE